MYSNGTVLAVLLFQEGVARPPARSTPLRSALCKYTHVYIFRANDPSAPTLIHPFAFFPAAAIFSAIRSLPPPVHSLAPRPRPLNFLRCYCFHRLFFARRSHEYAIRPTNSRPVLILRRDLLIKKVPVARCLLDGLSSARDGWNVEHTRRGCHETLSISGAEFFSIPFSTSRSWQTRGEGINRRRIALRNLLRVKFEKV